MAANGSFTIFAERLDAEVGYDGLFVILNTSTVASGKYIEIKAIEVSPTSPIGEDLTYILGNQGIISVDRISAHSGGTTVVPGKFDTGSADLPGAVVLKSHPESVTQVSTYRRSGDALSTHNITTAIPFQAMMRSPGICDVNESGRNTESHNLIHKASDSALEPFVLREGEGIAVFQRNFGVPQAFHFSVTIRNASSGATYRYRLPSCSTPKAKDEPIWSFLNGSGSGVVLEVWIISHTDLGEQNIPRLRIIKTQGISGIAEVLTTITPSKHDTDSDLSGMVVYGGACVAYPKAASEGATINYLNYQATPITNLEQQRMNLYRTFLLAEPKYSLTHTPQLRFENETITWPGACRGTCAIDEAIVLYPGEGLAIVGGGGGVIETSEMAVCDVTVRGRIRTDVVAGGGGATSFAF